MVNDQIKPLKFTSWEVVKRFLILDFILVLVIGLITLIIYYNELPREIRIIQNNEKHQINKLKEIINVHLEFIFDDLLILAEHNLLMELIDKYSKTDREALAKTFLSFSIQKQIFDQLRLLDTTGKEIVRINYNNGDSYIVPADKLQDKGKRYYFQDTFVLDRGEIYISPFDLNIEEGRIEQPLKPVIRFGMPVFNSNNQKSGILILNYLGGDLLEHLNWMNSTTFTGLIMLINKDGYWLKSPNKEDEWAFMFDNKSDNTFGKKYPDVWQQVNSNYSGQVNTEDGLFTFNTIYPLLDHMKSSTGSGSAYKPSDAELNADEYIWKIISWMPTKGLTVDTKRLLSKILQLDGVLFLLSTILLWYLVFNRALRKSVQKDLEKYQHHLEELVETRTKMLQNEIVEHKRAKERAEASDNVKTLFLANMSHEIRTPLNTILGFTSLIEESSLNAIGKEERKFFDVIRNSGERLMNTVHEILDISQIESGTYSMKIEDFNLVSEVRKLVDGHQITAKEKQLKLEFNCSLKRVLISADRYGICQSINNIIDNAIKYTKEGEITLNLRQKSNDAILTIQDTGIGMSQEYLGKLFKIFTQESEGYSKKYQGIGLGMSIVKRHMDLNQVNITVDSTQEKGTTFTLTFPNPQLISDLHYN